MEKLKRIVESSSISTLVHAVRADHWISRICWFCLLLICILLTISQSVIAISLFYTHPIGTTIKINNKAHLHFPSVTICPTNPYKKTFLLESEIFRQLNNLQLDYKNGKSVQKRFAVVSNENAGTVKKRLKKSLNSINRSLWIVDQANGILYYSPKNPKTPQQNFDNAAKFCASFGASLPTFHSSAEESAFVQLSSSEFEPKTSHYWLGYKCGLMGLFCNNAGNFGWSDGNGYTYQHWDTNQPTGANLFSGQKCVNTKSDANQAGISADCGQNNEVVCQLRDSNLCSTQETTTGAMSTETFNNKISSFTMPIIRTNKTSDDISTSAQATTNPTFTLHLDTTTTTTTFQPVPNPTTSSTYSTKQVQEFLRLENNTDSISHVSIVEDASPFILASMDSDTLSMFGYQLKDIVADCRYDNRKCNLERDFLQWNNVAVGNCFTFNHKQSKVARRDSSRTGLTNGLTLYLSLSQEDYLPISSIGGVKVLIDDVESSIFVESEGYFLSPGSNTDFAIGYKELSRLSSPYGECVESNSSVAEYMFDDGQYSYEGCIRSCYQKRVVDQCKCSDPRVSRISSSKQHPHTRICNISDYLCVQSVSDNSTSTKDQCPCVAPCSEKIYSVVESSSKIFRSSSNHFNTTVNIYFQSFTYLVYVEIPAYDLLSLLSNFGGIVGNTLGASVITVLELIALFVFGIFFYLNEITYKISR